jgi:hypothetical protein
MEAIMTTRTAFQSRELPPATTCQRVVWGG